MADTRTEITKAATELYRSIPEKNVGRLLLETSPEDLRELSLLDAISENTYICSPGGVVLHFDMRAALELLDLWGFTVFDIMRVGEEHPNSEEIPEKLYFKYKLIRYQYNEIMSDMNADGGGPLHFLENSGLEYLHSRLALFYERVGYTICFDAFDYIRRAHNFVESAEFVSLQDILRPFCGWSICVTEGYANDQWLDDYRKVFQRQTSPTGSTPAAGRPATIRRATKEAYELLFPEGHGAKSWLSALRLVNERTGYAASLDTLKRAIRPLSTEQNAD